MRLPILKPPYANVDELVPPQGGVSLIDGYFDEAGGLRRRPGLWNWWRADVLNGCDGLHWWHEKKLLIAVCGGRAYAFDDPSTKPIEITSPQVRLRLNSPVQFASLGAQLFMVNGARIVRWAADGAGAAIYLDRPDDPKIVETMTAFGGRLIVNEVNAPRALFTETIPSADLTLPVWSSEDIGHESSNDNVTVVRKYGAELIVLGPVSLEFQQDVGTSPNPFQRSFYTTDVGCIAPNSPVIYKEKAYWLNQRREVVEISGHSVRVISTPIQAKLDDLDNVTDCRGFSFYRWLVFTFPSSDVTWVFDTLTEGWMQWAYWDKDLIQYRRYRGQCCQWVPEWGLHFMGGLTNGRIYLASKNFMTDGMEPIRMYFKTAHIDHGTAKWKLPTHLFFRMRRGQNVEL